MEAIEIGLVEREFYSEHDLDLRRVKQKIRIIKVKGNTHVIEGFITKFIKIGFYDEKGEFVINFMCKLRDVKKKKEIINKKK